MRNRLAGCISSRRREAKRACQLFFPLSGCRSHRVRVRQTLPLSSTPWPFFCPPDSLWPLSARSIWSNRSLPSTGFRVEMQATGEILQTGAVCWHVPVRSPPPRSRRRHPGGDRFSRCCGAAGAGARCASIGIVRAVSSLPSAGATGNQIAADRKAVHPARSLRHVQKGFIRPSSPGLCPAGIHR